MHSVNEFITASKILIALEYENGKSKGRLNWTSQGPIWTSSGAVLLPFAFDRPQDERNGLHMDVHRTAMDVQMLLG